VHHVGSFGVRVIVRVSAYVHVCVYICIHAHMQIDWKKGHVNVIRERITSARGLHVIVSVCAYMYIYMYIHVHTHVNLNKGYVDFTLRDCL